MAKTSFVNRTVLITGASSGIGEALAEEFAEQGAQLVLAARRKERLEALATRLEKVGTRSRVVECDVTRDGDLERAVQAAVEAFGSLDIVVANAGFGVAGDFGELSLDDYRRQFETNVFGVLRTAFAALPELRKSRGSLVLLGSVAGHVSLPGSTPYSMSKFAVRAFSEGLHAELAAEGVSVTLISPGFVRSEIRRVDNQGRLREGADQLEEHTFRSLVMPADRAAREIVSAVAAGRREAIITGHGKAAVWVQRHFPWVFHLAAARGLRSRGRAKSR
jgi:short-subunit dehydrogenase